MNDNVLYMWDTMVDLGIATNDELGLACALCGTNEETMSRVLYIRTGYRTIEQMLEDEEEEEEDEEPCDIDSDFGFDPYEGCYTYDC